MPSNKLDTSVLFQPFSLGKLSLKNRVVMAPMTRNFSPEGIPSAANLAYYQKRAQGEVGLILSEGTVINRPTSRNETQIPFFHGEAALAGWKKIVDSVHQAGGRMGPQIWHVGSQQGMSGWEPEQEVESPSGLAAPGVARGKTMSEEDIQNTIDAFTQAAIDTKRLGFDVVEIHGAHGYLIDQFFWQETNIRDDRWGGKSLKERSRFAIEIIKSVREALGPDFPILLRLSQWKAQDYNVKLADNPAEMEAWLQPLAEAGVDIFHCSQRRFWEPEFPQIDGEEGLNFAGWAKKLTGKASISVGSVGLSGDVIAALGGEGSTHSGIEKLLTRMEKQEFDLIAVGRALLSDSQWLSKIKRGAESELTGFSPAHLAELV